MRPLRLSMEGFGTFRERVDLDFDGVDLVAFIGATGAGKSTVIDAITFALYGSVARYDDNRNVVNAINQTCTRARVELDFEVGDRRYTAVRVVQRTTTGGASTKEARLESLDEVLAGDARGMTDRVEDLLGLDVDQFNRTVVLPQGRFAGFLHDKPADRQKTMRQLLGFEIYNRIGQAARDREKETDFQISTIEDELARRATDLTPERREELQQALDRCRAASETIKAAAGERDKLMRDVEPLEGRANELESGIAAVDAIRCPDGVAEIDEATASTSAKLAEALAARADARSAADAANQDKALGPDVSRVTIQLSRFAERHRVASELVAARESAFSAEQILDTATLCADAALARQRELDAHLETGRSEEAVARANVDAASSLAQIEQWASRHGRHNEAVARLAEAGQLVATESASVAPLADALTGATRAADEVRAIYEQARVVGGAAALVSSLAVGQPCPVCRQPVVALPEHDLSAELAAAELADRQAQLALRQSTAEHDEAVNALRRAEARRDSLVDAASSAAQELAGAPTPAELDDQRRRAELLDEAYGAARQRLAGAQEAADAHRRDPATVAALIGLDEAKTGAAAARATVAATQTRFDTLDQEVAAGPDEAALRAELETATRLADEATAADARRRDAEHAADDAQAGNNQAKALYAAAVQVFLVERERVARLGAPEVGVDQLEPAWQALTTWATATRESLESERMTVNDAQVRLRGAIDAAEARIRISCAGALEGDVAGIDVDEARDRLVSRSAELQAALTAFDRELEQMKERRDRVKELRVVAAVAEQLGLLLRTNRFEEWLMESALGSLADTASATLRELSGGQFSLELHDGTFMVRDHTNGDERRSARTLSGGETFLASLSLALALANATSELAAEGAPPIESIFLDEGFGTLDATTLDTVAAAIEELGATGRMVGIITHIHELADRMPVRFEVTKAGGTSTIARIES